ncbi:MAG: hypothetical protein AAF791_01935 [Bacteroidota bacterium]
MPAPMYRLCLWSLLWIPVGGIAQPLHVSTEAVDLPPTVLMVQAREVATDSLPDLRPALAGLGALSAFVVASPVGYVGADALVPDTSCSDDLCISSSGFLGVALFGTAASGLAAHWISRPDDPLWRTVLGAVALQSLYLFTVDQIVQPDEPLVWYLVGVPTVAMVGSAAMAHVGER